MEVELRLFLIAQILAMVQGCLSYLMVGALHTTNNGKREASFPFGGVPDPPATTNTVWARFQMK